jgi:hypothetical protein
MKYLMIVKGPENAGMPPQSLFDAIDRLIADQKKSGVLVDAAGLMPTAKGGRVRIERGRIKVIDGPFTEAKEVIGGFSMVNAASKEEAMRMAKEFMDLHIEHWPEWEGECEVREVATG